MSSPQSFKFEHIVQPFEPQTQPAIVETHQNNLKEQTPTEFEYEPHISNLVVPMTEQDNKSNKSFDISDNVFALVHKSYAVNKVFIFYCIETIIYVFYYFIFYIV